MGDFHKIWEQEKVIKFGGDQIPNILIVQWCEKWKCSWVN